MKKTALFLITAFILISARMVFSQNSATGTSGFFMPQSELQPRYEKLPPVPAIQPRLPSARAAYEQRSRQQLQNKGHLQNVNNAQTAAVQPVVIRRKVKQYIAVDGRFIPVYEDEPSAPTVQTASAPNTAQPDIKPQTAENTSPEQNIAIPAEQNIILPPSQTAFLPANQIVSSETPEPVQPITRETQPVNIADNSDVIPQVPQVQNADPDLPSYRNRYAQYLGNLQIFHQTGQMPYDAELEKTLGKLSSSRKTVLFKGIIK